MKTLTDWLYFLDTSSRVQCPEITCDQAAELAALLREMERTERRHANEWADMYERVEVLEAKVAYWKKEHDEAQALLGPLRRHCQSERRMSDHATDVLRMIRHDMDRAIRGGVTGGQKTNGSNGPLDSARQLPSVVSAFRRYIEEIDAALELDKAISMEGCEK